MTGFVAVFEMPYVLLPDLKFDQFPGLKSVELLGDVVSQRLVEGGPTQGIISLWDTEASFLASKQTFLSNLIQYDSQAELVWAGYRQRSLQSPRRISTRIWTALNGQWGFFVALVAGLGVLQTAGHYWNDLFQAPRTQEISSQESVDVLAGDAWKVEYHLQNASRDVDNRVTIRRILWCQADAAKDSDPILIREPNVTLPTITPGLHAPYFVAGVTDPNGYSLPDRKHGILHPNKPGLYEVILEGTTSGGYLASSHSWRFAKKLQVWDIHAHGKPYLEEFSGKKTQVKLVVPILIGQLKPKVKCVLTLQGCRVDNVATTMPLEDPPREDNKTSTKQGRVQWTSKLVGPMRSYLAVVSLSDDLYHSRDEWLQITESLK